MLDVANDAEWLKLRLASFAGGSTNLSALAPVFIDRVVLFVDGHVQFVKDAVSLQAWRALGTRGGGEVLSADSY